MPTSLNDLKAVARRYGAKVEDEQSDNFHSCRVEAPAGKIWAEGNVHELVDETNWPWKPDYADMISRMEHGLSDCPDSADCEWCHPSTDD